MPRLFQGLEDQGKLDRRDVLHFVDHDKIVARPGDIQEGLSDEIEVVAGVFLQPSAVFFKEGVQIVALRFGKDALTYTQLAVGLARMHTMGSRGDDAADFFKCLMRVDALVTVALAFKPAGKFPPGHFTALGQLDGLGEFAVREKYRLLPRMLETIGVIQIAGALC
jgi:hypothetical protein